jgi:histidinol-phosphate aminotransferase
VNDPVDLVRADLRDFAGYVWLNANESALPNLADDKDSCRRYPEPQPQRLRVALAQLYGCRPDQLMVGRGSDEAIDLLVRTLCAPGRDGVLVTPPVFGMYAVSARVQGAPLVEVPLRDQGDRFDVDFEAIAGVVDAGGAKLVFLCSPSNPTGGAIPIEAIALLARRCEGRAIIVVDEAYGEYSEVRSAAGLLPGHRNVAVLRTLSKAHGLAAARIGCVIADASIIGVLRACQAPYPVPSPSATLAMAALAPEALASTRRRTADTVRERERMRACLCDVAGVDRVDRSQGNFLLVHFDDASEAYRRLLARGVVVRDQRAASGLGQALRITIGSASENERVLAALGAALPTEAETEVAK